MIMIIQKFMKDNDIFIVQMEMGATPEEVVGQWSMVVFFTKIIIDVAISSISVKDLLIIVFGSIHIWRQMFFGHFWPTYLP